MLECVLDPLWLYTLVQVKVVLEVTDHFLLGYGDFIQLPVPVFQLRGWVPKEPNPTNKDCSKEGSASPFVTNQGWKSSLVVLLLMHF